MVKVINLVIDFVRHVHVTPVIWDKKENNYKANDADDNTVLKVKEDHTMNRSWCISKGAANISNISKNHQVEIRGPQTNLTGSRKRTNNVENLLLSMESTNVDK